MHLSCIHSLSTTFHPPPTIHCAGGLGEFQELTLEHDVLWEKNEIRLTTAELKGLSGALAIRMQGPCMSSGHQLMLYKVWFSSTLATISRMYSEDWSMFSLVSINSRWVRVITIRIRTSAKAQSLFFSKNKMSFIAAIGI